MQDQPGEQSERRLLPVIHPSRGALRVDQNPGDHLRITHLMDPERTSANGFNLPLVDAHGLKAKTRLNCAR